MRVKALKVIRSSHLSNDIVRPGDIGEVLTTSTERSGRKLLKVRWANGMEGVALPSDVEEIVTTFCEHQFCNGYCVGCNMEEPSLAIQENQTSSLLPAATVSLLPSDSEAASSSPRTVHPKLHGDRPGQELVGSLPLLSYFGFTLHGEFDLGGES